MAGRSGARSCGAGQCHPDHHWPDGRGQPHDGYFARGPGGVGVTMRRVAIVLLLLLFGVLLAAEHVAPHSYATQFRRAPPRPPAPAPVSPWGRMHWAAIVSPA